MFLNLGTLRFVTRSREGRNTQTKYISEKYNENTQNDVVHVAFFISLLIFNDINRFKLYYIVDLRTLLFIRAIVRCFISFRFNFIDFVVCLFVSLFFLFSDARRVRVSMRAMLWHLGQ